MDPTAEPPTASAPPADGTRIQEPGSTADGGPAARPAEPLPDLPGYELLGELGRGDMGVVYHARDVALGRAVAVKLMLAGEYATAPARDRFLAEAAAMARLAHPHVVPVLQFGRHAGLPFLVMEYVPGGTLADRFAAGPLPPAELVGLLEPVARAVGHVHRLGLVHRDLKPANVLIGPDRGPKVTDFGLAKEVGAEGRTMTGAILGTPRYMAPEVAMGDARTAGPAADVWALGVMLYEGLTGARPFDGADTRAVLDRIKTADPALPRTVHRAVPAELEAVCLRCLEKDPGRRYPDAVEVADELARWRAGEPVRARAVGAAERAAKWVRRRPYLAGLAVALVLALVAGTASTSLLAVWALRQKGRADEQAATAAAREAEARTEAARAAAVSDALAGVFRSSDPLDIFTAGLAPPAWERQRTRTAEQLLRDPTPGSAPPCPTSRWPAAGCSAPPGRASATSGCWPTRPRCWTKA